MQIVQHFDTLKSFCDPSAHTYTTSMLFRKCGGVIVKSVCSELLSTIQCIWTSVNIIAAIVTVIVAELALTQLGNVQLHSRHIYGRKAQTQLNRLTCFLNLLVMVDQMHSDRTGIITKFPNVFSGLGSLSGEFEIKLKLDAKPCTLYTPRKVPYPL